MKIFRKAPKTLFSVAMHREKEEQLEPYRRDFLTYDNHVLDGEIFLQVSTTNVVSG